ncbi:claudin-4-like [Anguilla anguilla]|uniref:claudin-4-like n=1 Tax=Anguilla anguilla TaxID=7936 RepID=UPI0015AA01B9|nr:claudin-4-like [Anguilla anguilla]
MLSFPRQRAQTDTRERRHLWWQESGSAGSSAATFHEKQARLILALRHSARPDPAISLSQAEETGGCSLVLSLSLSLSGKAEKEMGRIGKEVTGQVFCFIGFIGVSLTCGIPMWRVTSYIGANIVTGQIVWDGLWMNCVMQSTGQMQCSIHQFLLRLSQDLQAARALVVSSVVVAVIGIALSFVGGKCTSCLSKEASQAKVVILGGAICIVAGVLCLIPVCWSAAYTISDFESPATIETQKRELGASIYIGWGSALLLIVGGSILCTSCPPDSRRYGYYPGQYPYPGTTMTPGPYVPVSYAPTKYPPPNYAQPGYAAPTYAPPGRVAPTYAPPGRAPTIRSQYAPSGYL